MTAEPLPDPRSENEVHSAQGAYIRAEAVADWVGAVFGFWGLVGLFAWMFGVLPKALGWADIAVLVIAALILCRPGRE